MGARRSRADVLSGLSMDDLFRIKRHDDLWYVQGARGNELEDFRVVAWGFHDRTCASAVCETLNAIVLADAFNSDGYPETLCSRQGSGEHMRRVFLIAILACALAPSGASANSYLGVRDC